MAGSTISNHVTISVTLGSAAYPSPLTITQAGFVDPGAGGFYSATGLVATISAGYVLNEGTVAGGLGAAQTTFASGYVELAPTGGTGVDLAGGSLINTGSIVGGTGGSNTFTGEGGTGGYGVVGTGSSLTNDGTILGGNGGKVLAVPNGGSGGSGVDLTNSSLTNNGLIIGGAGAYGNHVDGFYGTGGSGGTGVDLTGSSVTNSGTIAGGAGAVGTNGPDSSGGVGVSLAAGSSLSNTGSITGGAGDAGYLYPGSGGAGAEVASSSLTNVGVITGGTGGAEPVGAFSGSGGGGGAGVVVTSGNLTNDNAIDGGNGGLGGHIGGGGGGTGAVLSDGSTLTNDGNITGGAGAANQGSEPFISGGGFGVSATDSTVTNDGGITGGFGGFGTAGVILTSSILINDGYIAGGRAAMSLYGGAGVAATSSTVTNDGTIAGWYYGVVLDSGGFVTNAASATITGHSGVSITGGGTLVNGGTIVATGGGTVVPSAAVSFSGTGTDLLVADPGAVFVGAVVAQGSPATLELASGASAGAITGIGTSFTGFGTITVDPHATWTVSGSVTGSGTFSLGASSDLVLNGGVTAASPVYFTADAGTLGLGDPAGFGATVYGFQRGDTFDFTSITSTGSIAAGVNGSNDLTLTSDGSLLAEIKLDPAQDFGGVMFRAVPDGATGTEVVIASSVISNHVTISVTLGSAAYPSLLAVTDTGFVDPGAGGFYGAAGVVATIAAGAVLNQGTIAGGLGTTLSVTGGNDFGGTGVDLAGGSLTNTGYILGGVAGYNRYNVNDGVSGGVGIVVASGSVTNDGTILGGDGANAAVANAYGGGDGAGGVGAILTSSYLYNAGLIGGGSAVGYWFAARSGAVGVDATGSRLTNLGTITGGNGAYGGVEGGDPGGAGGAGVSLVAGSTLINMGLIVGGNAGGRNTHFYGFYAPPSPAGIGVYAADSSLTNDGVIAGSGGGVFITDGSLTNNGNGVIFNGVTATDDIVFNSGVIDGMPGSNGYGDNLSGGAGVALSDGSILINQGSITGGEGGSQRGYFGFYYFGGGVGVLATDSALVNDGTIAGGSFGFGGVAGAPIYFSYARGVGLQGGLLTNSGFVRGVGVSNGVVVNNGTINGVYASNSTVIYTGVGASNSTVINNGTINGGVAFSGGTNLLVDDPGAVFTGGASGSSLDVSDTLELASGASMGTLNGLGTSFTGFGTITVDPDARWVVNGSVSGNGPFSLGGGSDVVLNGSVSGNGQFSLGGSSDLVVNGSVTGSGTFSLAPGADILFNGGVTATRSVYVGDYAHNNNVIGLGDPAGFAATVYGFQPGDAFDFTSITSTGSMTAGVNGSNELTLSSGGSLLAEVKLDPKQSFAGDGFKATPDGAGTLVTEVPLCFLAGTLIATPQGEVPVEHLRVGDMVLTARGAVRPVVWLGAGRVLATRGRRSAATPVVVRKGALADNVPHHDLRVTKAHALSVDGALIPVEFLVNHRSIHWDDRAQEVALYHVELATHDVLLANGAPAESYRDDGNRWLFRNANSRWGLAAQRPFAPVLTGGPVVDAAWLRLLERAGPRPGVPLTDDPDLHLLVDGGRVEAASRAGRFHVFGLAGAADGARIGSRAGVPQELGLARDPRRLGVAVRRIVIRQGSRARTVEADDARLAVGFHAFEAEDGWRWTDGEAVLPGALFAGFDGPLEVVVLCGGAAWYVAEGVERRAA